MTQTGRVLFIALLAVTQIAMAQQRNSPLRVATAVAPKYPLVAYTSETEGSVEVDIEVRGDGTVIRAKALNGPYELRPASEKAAVAWIFEASPQLQEVRTARLTFRFTLNKSQRTGLSAAFRAPFEMEVIGEDYNNTEILADPPIEAFPSRQKK